MEEKIDDTMTIEEQKAKIKSIILEGMHWDGFTDLDSTIDELHTTLVKESDSLPFVRLSADDLIQSLGECKKDNGYEIEASSDGRWWLLHKGVGSGEPLRQWLTNRAEPDEA
jgi:hypothetical protein